MTNGDFGYTFVGSYLNQCARVEWWIIGILQSNSDSKSSKSKLPYLFGQRLKAVRELAEANAALFNKPARVVELMDRFAEPAKLRSSLAHAIVQATANQSGSYYLFHNVGTNERFWLTECDMQDMLTNLKKLVKEITDQKLKSFTPPSSPPQPKQGAASGP